MKNIIIVFIVLVALVAGWYLWKSARTAPSSNGAAVVEDAFTPPPLPVE